MKEEELDPKGNVEASTLTISPTCEDELWASHKANPRNWSTRRRASIIFVLTLTNLIGAMTTTAFEPGIDQMMRDFNNHEASLKGFSMSVYTMGYCIGMLVVAPASEIYGRLWPLRIAYPVFLVSLVLCSISRHVAMFITFHGVMGFAGIVWVVLGPAMVPDLMPEERRGLCLSTMMTGVSLGPTLGPVMGGFIIQHAGWRWALWTCAIAFSVCMLLAICCLEETYGPLVRTRAFPKPNEKESVHPPTSLDQTNFVQRLRTIGRSPWLRPFRMLLCLPMVLFFTIYTVICNSYLLIMFALLGLTFQDCYGFSDSAAGLAYLGMAVGFVFSQITLGRFSDVWSSRMARRRGDVQIRRPEDRLPPLALGAVVMPAGLLMLGWGTKTHWIVPMIGSGVFAAGYMYTYLPVMMYLVDSYASFAASAIVACSAVRSVTAAIIPLAAQPMYDRLGYAWGNSLLAFMALAFAPLVVVILRWGEPIRLRFQTNFKQ